VVETGNWVEPEVTTIGCCELPRWQLRLAGAEDDCFQSRLAGLAVNSAAPADVRLAVAEHPKTPASALADLARGDAEADVIRAACANPALPLSVMRELSVAPSSDH
jgi:hypothetical protein